MMVFSAGSGYTADQIAKARDAYQTFFDGFNLFAFLRTFPVGISSLMQAKRPILTPFGSPQVVNVDVWAMFGWIFLFTLVGWILGGFYFNRVSALVMEPAKLLRSITQSVLLSILFMIVSLVIGMPVMIILAFISQGDAAVFQVAFFAIAMFGSWFIVPIFFAPHGIFLRGQNIFLSISSSVRMARYTLPSASMFVLTIFVISQGLNYLWNVPNDNSWMLLVGIAGHAFITTSMLAASFIYYRDMNAWLETALTRLRPGTDAPRQAL
jgi:hypothetical protein